MAGLRKAKKYDWKDSNLALFGSDTDKQVKKESAETEPAWQGAGQEVGLRIWRIVQFKVADWPKEDHGEFYNGDSYIILNTYKKPDSDELEYDLHFWIGAHSTQDEYGTAAYKTVELDTLLDDKPVQHREVSGAESSLFKSYFEALQLMDGGAETGFRHVQPEEYQPRLFKVSKEGKKCVSAEIAMCKEYIKSDDVFVLDQGLQIYQFNGKDCQNSEKFKASTFISGLKNSRGNVKVDILEEDSTSDDHPFFAALTEEPVEGDVSFEIDESTRVMKRLSNADGSLDLEDVDGFSKDLLDSNDVFIVDGGKQVFVWVGSNASSEEKKNGFAYAQTYIMKTLNPLRPVTVLGEGKTSKSFDECFE